MICSKYKITTNRFLLAILFDILTGLYMHTGERGEEVVARCYIVQQWTRKKMGRKTKPLADDTTHGPAPCPAQHKNPLDRHHTGHPQHQSVVRV
jgi:hypothetical protein